MTPNLEAMDICIRRIHTYSILKQWPKVITEIIWLREHLEAIEATCIAAVTGRVEDASK